MSDLELFPPSSYLAPSPSPSLPQCDYSEWSPTWVLIPSVYLLAFLLGSLGNSLVLWAYLDRPHSSQPLGANTCSCTKRPFRHPGTGSSPRLPGSSRSLTDSLIASLAVADLAFLVTLPLWAAYTALDYHWPFGQPLCQVSSYLVALNMYASVFSLTALSVERYWLIAGHRRSSRAQGPGTCRVLWVVGSVWLVAGVLALPALLLRTVRKVELGEEPDDYWQEVEEGEGDQVDEHRAVIFSCAMDYSSLISTGLGRDERERAELLWTAALGLKSTLIGFLLPLAVLLVCYCSLGHLVSRHFKQGPRPDPQRQRRLLRVIVTLVMAFFLCWLPFHTNKSLSMLVELGLVPYSCLLDRTLLAAHPYATCLGYLNSCLNPLLYACCDPAFRQRCRVLLPCGGAGAAREARQGGWRGCRGSCESSQVADKEEDVEEEEEDREQPSRTREETVDGMEEDKVEQIRDS
ncbi:apelin receptor 2 [Hypomesus transpacificus]|uniref:apelin receptor 2 n=1 Tax=Hypomesus transpacificus TaxID=137520 RepID=UPI001F073E90|nr:apelin receptor 2 [Hypomesus transpacificus]XP_046897553.1 apelin receptor 2 [Hypomesus transpacificus]